MQLYRWKARNPEGEVSEGEKLAPHAGEVTAWLARQGLEPLEVKKATETVAPPRPQSPPASTARRRILARGVKPVDLAAFFRSLYSAVNAGLPYSRMFEIVLRTVRNKRIRELTRGLAQNVREGRSLSSEMAKRPDIIPPFALGILKAGETSGNLDLALLNLAEYYEHEHAFQQEVRWQTILPKAELGCIVLLLIPLLFILPWASHRVQKLAPQFNLNLQGPIFALLLVAALVYGVLLFYQLFKHNRPVARFFDTVKLAIPGLARLNRNVAVARFMNMLALAVKSGLSYHQGVELALPAVGNVVLEEKIAAQLPRLARGEKLSEVLAPLNLLPFQAMQMILTGEETGELDQMLSTAATELQQQARADLKVLTVILTVASLALILIFTGYIIISFWVQYYNGILSL